MRPVAADRGLPRPFVGKGFFEVFTEMKRENNSIVLAVQRGENGEVISNPPVDYTLQDDDLLIVVAARNGKE